MSRFFPHTAYAEDQPLSKSILSAHVITRTITLGTIVASGITATRQVIPYFRPTGADLKSFTTRLILSASTGTVAALGIGAFMVAGRMYGREPIEWQDRAWRLRENLGQMETDDWTYACMGLGGALGAKTVGGWRGAVGGMGIGSVVGMLGYMAWRHGINGGKFPDAPEVKTAEKSEL